jgi:hypothetical protein
MNDSTFTTVSVTVRILKVQRPQGTVRTTVRLLAWSLVMVINLSKEALWEVGPAKFFQFLIGFERFLTKEASWIYQTTA